MVALLASCFANLLGSSAPAFMCCPALRKDWNGDTFSRRLGGSLCERPFFRMPLTMLGRMPHIGRALGRIGKNHGMAAPVVVRYRGLVVVRFRIFR